MQKTKLKNMIPHLKLNNKINSLISKYNLIRVG